MPSSGVFCSEHKNSWMLGTGFLVFRGVDEDLLPLGYYAASKGNWMPTFPGNMVYSP